MSSGRGRPMRAMPDKPLNWHNFQSRTDITHEGTNPGYTFVVAGTSNRRGQ